MNITDYHSASIEKLREMPTRQLLAALRASRSRYVCGCRFHCGDEYLDVYERHFNSAQEMLYDRLKWILSTRENVVNNRNEKRTAQRRSRRERKQMKFAR